MAARFQEKLDATGGLDACWPWLGATVGKGYGHLGVGPRMVKAHRIALELKLGRPLLPGMNSLHRCDNPPCCNPAHLFEGTNADNVSDMVAKNRQPAQMRPRAECRNGHPRDEQLTYRRPNGDRYCRACATDRQRARRAHWAARSSVDGSVVSGGTLGQGTRRTIEPPNWREAGGSVSDPSSAVPPADGGIRTTEAISA